jgi:hypothetical protein
MRPCFLSRDSWIGLTRVRAKEDHSTNTLYIAGQDNVWREVSGVPAPSSDIRLMDAQKNLGLPRVNIESEEAEEAVLALFEELDNWEEKTGKV